MGLKTSGFVTDEHGERVLGQAIGNRVIDGPLQATAWSDRRRSDYERRSREDAMIGAFTQGSRDPRGYQRAVSERWHRRYPQMHDAGDAERALERAAATPVPDDDDLADNTMNLRRRIMGQ